MAEMLETSELLLATKSWWPMDSATWGLRGLPVALGNAENSLMPRPPEYQWFWGPA